jgi:hypothetical protein
MPTWLSTAELLNILPDGRLSLVAPVPLSGDPAFCEKSRKISEKSGMRGNRGEYNYPFRIHNSRPGPTRRKGGRWTQADIEAA